jgi:hypothetical protein
MKMNGQEINARNELTHIIPRENGPNFVFTVRSVLSYDEYNDQFPRPKPTMRRHKGEEVDRAVEDDSFTELMEEWSAQKMDWIVIQALAPTEWLEWSTIDMNDSKTFGNWNAEMLDASFTDVEIKLLFSSVMIVNGTNQATLDKAMDDFLAGPGPVLETQ